MRMPVVIEPSPVIESGTLDHERVAVPVSDGVSHPTGVGILLQGTAVHKDLAIGEIRVEDEDERRGLDDFHHLGPSAVPGGGVAGTEWHTEHVHIAPAEVFFTLLDQ